MKVAKFGGSSLSSAGQLEKVAKIVQNDPAIRVVVVSAPGKRESSDTKVTDLLINLYTTHTNGKNTDSALAQILDRYQSIIEELKLPLELIETFQKTLQSHLNEITDSDRLMDALKACGEDFNAQLFSAYLNQLDVQSRYLSPLEAGILVTDEPSNARLLDDSYQIIEKWRNANELLVVPGFFGYSKEGNIVTFPRGGSDITGAIMTRGIKADIYENYTDLSHIYSAHPGLIKDPHPIEEITYREMRELSYSGFSIFHDEALEPLYQVNIPVMIRDTNHPEIEGTKIVAERSQIKEYPVIGISSDGSFTAITLRKYLLNRELGYTSRLLQIFEDYQISIEHVPTGIDNITVIFRSKQLKSAEQLKQIISEIETNLQPGWIQIEDDFAILAIVGEGMKEVTGIVHKATTALAKKDINIRMINQGGSQISLFIGIKLKNQVSAIESLYEEYFGHLS